MSDFYGIFQDMRELYADKIVEYGIYDEIFSKIYSNLQAVSEEIKYYLENAYCTGNKILEIACGDGSNYMIPLAQKGFQVDGVEISESMIERFQERKEKLPVRVKKLLKIYQGNVFEFEPEEKYDLIIIPSTTICLLADDEEMLGVLFQKIYGWLNPGGRFMFDYRIDQVPGSPYTSEMVTQCCEKNKYFMMMQEFNNYIQGRAIVNMYVESLEGDEIQKYIASSDKRIITEKFVQDMIRMTNFELHNSYEVKLTNAQIKLLVLRRSQDE